MKRFWWPWLVHGCIAALLTVALYSGLTAHHTAPPKPHFAVRTDPQFWFRTWPADFNDDGRTDLIAGARAVVNHVSRVTDVIVSLGRGDGTFLAPQRLGIAAQPLGTGDFNRDRATDAVLLGADGTLLLLPGNGDGTFGIPHRITSGIVSTAPFASISDFNSDGFRDIAVGTDEMPRGGCGVLLFSGNGDLTFNTPVQLPVSHYSAMAAMVGDVNKDGDRDLAVVSEWSSLFVFINRGNLRFERTEIRTGRRLTDITVVDLNRDSNLDLIVAAPEGTETDGKNDGRVLVLLGNGYGMFRDPVAYDTGVSGEFTVVAGDFNRDGRLDVATGNTLAHSDAAAAQRTDSISIMPGDGHGRLLSATTYVLGRNNQTVSGTNQSDSEYVLTHNSLNTSDLDGDRHTDLIASPGAILLNRATPPIFAGFRGF